MPHPKRYVEVRLRVVATVNLTDLELADALKRGRRQPASVPELVANEVVSNLEFVSHIDTTLLSLL
jgi:hypothetical protein